MLCTQLSDYKHKLIYVYPIGDKYVVDAYGKLYNRRTGNVIVGTIDGRHQLTLDGKRKVVNLKQLIADNVK